MMKHGFATVLGFLAPDHVMPALKRSALFAVCAVGVLLASTPARADETEAARLFREARALMLDGSFDQACPKIAESHRLEPHVGTLLNLAACHEHQGKIGTAWVEFQQALTAAKSEGQADRERLARERIAALEPRLPWLTISVAPAAIAEGLEVTLDGAVIQPVAWGKELPVDPGPHIVVARAPARTPFESNVELREAEHRTVAIGSLESPALPPVPTAEPAPTLVVERRPSPVAKPSPSNAKGRFVVEVGLVVGYMSANTSRARLASSSGENGIELRSNQSSQGSPESCASRGCSYSLPQVNGAIAGVNLFAGYAISDTMHFGGRLLAAARIEHGGGSIVVVGPALQLHMVGPVWTGVSALVGTASVSGNGDVRAPAGYSQTGGGPFLMDGSTEESAGIGLELGVRIAELPRGSLRVLASPFFLVGGGGNAWAFPLAVAYRFQ